MAVIQVTLRGESVNDFPRQVGLDQLQWVGKWVCCEPATCHRNAVSKTSKGHGNPRTELPIKRLLFSIHLLIHSLIDWLLDSLYWSIHWLIFDMIHLDTTKMEKPCCNFLDIFVNCWHPMGPAGPWWGLPLPHRLLGATPAFSGASGVPSYPVPCSPALAA